MLKKILEKIFEQFDQFKSLYWLLLFLLVSWTFSFVNNEFVMTDYIIDEYWENAMQEQYDGYDEIAEEFEDDLEDFEESENPSQYFREFLVSLAFITVGKIFQFGLISAALHIAFTFATGAENIGIGTIFKSLVIAQFIFFIPMTVKFVWFLGIQDSYTYEEVTRFSLFSVYSLLEHEKIPNWLIYPLKTFNIFEVVFVSLLASGISQLNQLKFAIVLKPVVVGYGSLLTLGVLLRIYLSVIF